MTDLEREIEETLAKLSELVRLTPDWKVNVDFGLVWEEESHGRVIPRQTGWRTVTIRYRLDPRAPESQQPQIPNFHSNAEKD